MKKIIFNVLLIAGLAISFITFKSDINGKFNNGTSCGTCHGSANAATVVALSGLPTSYVSGGTYPVTFTITNTAYNNAGFNVLVSGGTLTAGTGSQVNAAKTQITHTAPKAGTAGVMTFDFTWTAPATSSASVTFSAVGNAVNNLGNQGGDMWNATTATVPAAPAANRDVQTTKINCYPNPTFDNITIDGIAADTKITVVNMYGQQVITTATFVNNKCIINCNNLAIGSYIVNAITKQGKATSQFIKN
jgi:Secretion system C-terminal sorting domain